MRPFKMSILILLLTVASTYAASHPDFTGQWKLDLDASDNMDDFAKAQGASWMDYTLIGNMSVTQTITQSENNITITIENMFKKRTEVMIPNGLIEEKMNEQGNLMKVRSFWSDDGSVLVTMIDTKMADEKPGQVVIKRSLSQDGGTMFQNIEIVPEKGQRFAAKRVFRKIGVTTDKK
ncbi:MAG: hypothetical protein WA151_11715 [Desulfatirhabdiaceae bacterium]